MADQKSSRGPLNFNVHALSAGPPLEDIYGGNVERFHEIRAAIDLETQKT